MKCNSFFIALNAQSDEDKFIVSVEKCENAVDRFDVEMLLHIRVMKFDACKWYARWLDFNVSLKYFPRGFAVRKERQDERFKWIDSVRADNFHLLCFYASVDVHFEIYFVNSSCSLPTKTLLNSFTFAKALRFSFHLFYLPHEINQIFAASISSAFAAVVRRRNLFIFPAVRNMFWIWRVGAKHKRHLSLPWSVSESHAATEFYPNETNTGLTERKKKEKIKNNFIAWILGGSKRSKTFVSVGFRLDISMFARSTNKCCRRSATVFFVCIRSWYHLVLVSRLICLFRFNFLRTMSASMVLHSRDNLSLFPSVPFLRFNFAPITYDLTQRKVLSWKLVFVSMLPRTRAHLQRQRKTNLNFDRKYFSFRIWFEFILLAILPAILISKSLKYDVIRCHHHWCKLWCDAIKFIVYSFFCFISEINFPRKLWKVSAFRTNKLLTAERNEPSHCADMNFNYFHLHF